MPSYTDTVRKVILWEYAKLICGSMIGDRTQYGMVQYKYKQLLDGQINPSSILRENKQFVQAEQECAYCGSVENLQWEHIVPRSIGGPDTIDNMVHACASCNRTKGTRDPYQWYSADDRVNEIPRLVLGKMLKLLFTAYEEQGLLDEVEWEAGRMPYRAELSRIFHQSLGRPKVAEPK